MGLFDTVFCRYPLPHHQDAEFQTKDLANLVAGEPMLGGLMDEYEITVDGGLRLHGHEREYVKDRAAPLGGYLKSVRDWWEDVPDVHGDVRIYTSDEIDGVPALVEFRIRFTNGRVQDVKEVERAAPSL
jgi:hypothetical protein